VARTLPRRLAELLVATLGDAYPASRRILGTAALDELTAVDEQHALARRRDLCERRPLVDHEVGHQEPTRGAPALRDSLASHDQVSLPVEDRTDLQFPSERLDVLPKGREVDVGPPFEF